MRIESDEERRFYEIESQKQNWSVRQLQRQYNSSLYERLALSKDKDSVLRLAQEGQTINKPDDIIKNPLTLFSVSTHCMALLPYRTLPGRSCSDKSTARYGSTSR